MASDTPETFSFTAQDCDAGERLDRFLAGHLTALSRSRLKTLIKEGHARHDGGTIEEPNYRVKPGDSFDITVPPAEPAVPRGEDIALDILYEDAHLIVINKPSGLVVHPAAGNWTGTLVNALIAHCGDSLSGIGGVRRPGIVHRLDKETTGVMVVAKTDRAHRALSKQFADHGRTGPLERRYRAFVWGAPSHPKGTISAPLGRKREQRQKMAVVPETGKEAITHYRVLQTFGDRNAPVASLVELSLETGRTHQIRVHMAHIGHPLIGDMTYGSGFKSKSRVLPDSAQEAISALGRQALHAGMLAFAHPETGETLTFSSDMPKELAEIGRSLQEV